jgi:hypothetical protein
MRAFWQIMFWAPAFKSFLTSITMTVGNRRYVAFHLMEQTTEGKCSVGARSPLAMARMASSTSRRAFSGGGVVPPSSSRRDI